MDVAFQPHRRASNSSTSIPASFGDCAMTALYRNGLRCNDYIDYELRVKHANLNAKAKESGYVI